MKSLIHPRSAAIGLVCLALGVAFGPPLAGAATETLKDVIVRNTTSNPVPVAPQGTTSVAGTVTVGNLPVQNGKVQVASAAPVLRRGRQFLNGASSSLSVPYGVVVTDVVVAFGDAHPLNGAPTEWCSVEILAGGAAEFVGVLTAEKDRDEQELHLQTGLRSTAEQPLEFFNRLPCGMHVSWTGYEG
jgi:hypothetical protein